MSPFSSMAPTVMPQSSMLYPMTLPSFLPYSYRHPAMHFNPRPSYPVHPVPPQERLLQTMDRLSSSPMHSYLLQSMAPQQVSRETANGSTRKRLATTAMTPTRKKAKRRRKPPPITLPLRKATMKAHEYIIEPITTLMRDVKLLPSGQWDVAVRFRGYDWYIGMFENRERAYLAYKVAGVILKYQNKSEHMSDEAIQELVSAAKSAACDAVERSRYGNYKKISLIRSGWRTKVFLKGSFHLIGVFEKEERAVLAWEVAHAILKPKQAVDLKRHEITRWVDWARTAAMDAMPVALDTRECWRVQLYFRKQFRFIGVFDDEEDACLACEVAHSILEPKNEGQMSDQTIQKVIDWARITASDAVAYS